MASGDFVCGRQWTATSPLVDGALVLRRRVRIMGETQDTPLVKEEATKGMFLGWHMGRVWHASGAKACRYRRELEDSRTLCDIRGRKGMEGDWSQRNHRVRMRDTTRNITVCEGIPARTTEGQSPLRCGCCCCCRAATGTEGTPRRNARGEYWAHVKPSSH